MGMTTSAKAARKAARESVLEATAEAARRSKLNTEDLTRFFVSMGRAENAQEWLDGQIAELRVQADRRRSAERREAGAALAAMRERGEQVRDIARLARIGERQVRELIRTAAEPGPAADDAEPGGATLPSTATDPGPAGAVGDDAAGDGAVGHADGDRVGGTRAER